MGSICHTTRNSPGWGGNLPTLLGLLVSGRQRYWQEGEGRFASCRLCRSGVGCQEKRERVEREDDNEVKMRLRAL